MFSKGRKLDVASCKTLSALSIWRKLTGLMLYAKRTNLLSAETWNLVVVRSCKTNKQTNEKQTAYYNELKIAFLWIKRVEI